MELSRHHAKALEMATRPNNTRGIIVGTGPIKRELVALGYATGRGTVLITDAGRDALAAHQAAGAPTTEQRAAAAREAREIAEAARQVTVREAALRLGKSRSTIYRWIKAGKLEAIRPAGLWIVTLPAA